MRLDAHRAKAGLTKLAGDLRGTRLWPLVIVMLVAIVAVPIALSKSSTGTPIASVPGTVPAPLHDTALPALNVESKAGASHLPGHGRDPFAQKGSNQTTAQSGATTTSPSGSGSGSSTSSSANTSGTAGGGATTSGSGGSPSPSSAPPQSSSTPPPSITPPNKHPATPTAGLTPDQAYQVSIGITNSSGGVDTVDPLQRLSPLPSAQQALVVELGVLKGGRRVLFAVRPGTVVGGSGTCTPGPIDCQILSLGQDQTESLSRQAPAGTVPVAEFAVTGITAARYPSVAAADRARRAVTSAGRQVLSATNLSVLPLFPYDPGVGAVLDSRTLRTKDVR